MNAQLERVADDFARAQDRLHSLAREVPEDAWPKRPDSGGWSIAECVAHLNLTSAAYLPILRDGITRAREIEGPAPRTYHRDLAGWLLWKGTGPPVRFRVKTAAAFVPSGNDPPSALVTEFDRLQAEQRICLRHAEGLPLGQVTITSPFNARIRYNLFACFTILPRHQHRHLWQAEQVWKARGGRR